MAITQCGNIEGSKNLKTININDCLIYANGSLANQIPQTASIFYANNLANFINYLNITDNKIPSFNHSDEIIKSTLLQKG
jgi:NAD/NADP transhydrogenase alpha subunit